MGIGDSIKGMADKAKEKISPDQAKRGVDAAADKVDDATDDRYTKNVDRGQHVAGGGIDRLYAEDEDPDQPNR